MVSMLQHLTIRSIAGADSHPGSADDDTRGGDTSLAGERTATWAVLTVTKFADATDSGVLRVLIDGGVLAVGENFGLRGVLGVRKGLLEAFGRGGVRPA